METKQRLGSASFLMVVACFMSSCWASKPDFKRIGHLQSTIVKRWMTNYSKQDPPSIGTPTEVHLGIFVNSFYSINEQTMDYSVNLYLRQTWRDPRLAFISPDTQVEEIKINDGDFKKLWLPDTFFRNEKESSYHDVTVANRLIRVNSSGWVYYVSKISATLSCPMKLHKYPLDTQKCPMIFESFGYTTDKMHFTWIDNPVDVDKGLQLPQFLLIEKLLYDCSRIDMYTGRLPCLAVEFVLRRDLGYFLIQVYVPSILIVILSWVSFWINIDASPARVSLGLLTVLTTTTMSGGARESLPRVSYIKAIDVWMIMCLVFVFASLIEYAVVNVAARHQPAKSSVNRVTPLNTPSNSHVVANNRDGGSKSTPRSLIDRILIFLRIRTVSINDSNRLEPAGVATKAADPDAGKRRARSIDKLSRKCFPATFLAFNIVYWILYTWPETKQDPGAGGGD